MSPFLEPDSQVISTLLANHYFPLIQQVITTTTKSLPLPYLALQDEQQADDETLEDILDNDLTWELEIARRMKRWRQKEIELRAERVSGKPNTCNYYEFYVQESQRLVNRSDFGSWSSVLQ